MLHELADTVKVITQGIGRYHKLMKRLNSLTIFIVFTSLTIIAAYSSSNVIRIVILGICIILLLLLIDLRKIVVNVFKIYIFTILLSVFLALPSVFIHMDYYGVTDSIARTLFISISSSIPMVVFSILVGLRDIEEIISVFQKQ